MEEYYTILTLLRLCLIHTHISTYNNAAGQYRFHERSCANRSSSKKWKCKFLSCKIQMKNKYKIV